MLHHELLSALAVKGQVAGEQLLIDNRKVVLIAKTADEPLESLGGGVNRRDAAGHPGLHAFQALDQPKIAYLDVVVDEKKVLRLDIEMLELEFPVHQIERFRCLIHIAKDLLARDA